MSKQHRLISYPAEPNLENSSFFALSSIGKNWKVLPRATFKIPLQNHSLCKLGGIIYSLTPTLKNVGKKEESYIK